MSTLKKVLAVIGVILTAIVGVLIGRGVSGGRGIPGVAGDIREIRAATGRIRQHNSTARDSINDSLDCAGELAKRNADNKADIDRAKEILRRAKARSSQGNDSRKPD